MLVCKTFFFFGAAQPLTVTSSSINCDEGGHFTEKEDDLLSGTCQKVCEEMKKKRISTWLRNATVIFTSPKMTSG